MSNTGKILMGLGLLLGLQSTLLAQSSLGCNNFNEAVPSTTAHLVDNANGTVNDPKTGLVWKNAVKDKRITVLTIAARVARQL